MRNTLKIVYVFLLVLCLPFFAYAEKTQKPLITIKPSKIAPGDIAVITIKNIRGPVEGTFNNKTLYFNASTSAQDTFKAILGIDLYIKPGPYEIAIKTNNATVRRTVTVSKKKYPVQRLTLPKDMVELSPENEERVSRDLKKITKIWPIDSLRMWAGNFVNPLPNNKIGTPFGLRRIINRIPKSSHSGVDITADEGTPVVAPNDGVVVLVDDQFYSGNSVVLDHGQGIHTMFFHLSKISVRYGQAIMKGDVIGFVGSTGRATGAHLHWGVRMQGARVDPMKLIHLKLD